jgi:oligopeptide transport system substrate-binding protein
MSEWVHQDHITLVPNPYYTANGMWPAPTLQQITFLMVTNGEADYAAYINDERDWTLVPDSDVNQVLNDPNLSQQSREYNELTTFWVHMNNAKAPLDNPMVRKALAMSIDRQALIRDIAGGVGLPFTSIIPPGMPGYQEGLGQELGFNPEGAKSMLAQAGFPNAQNFPTLTYSFATTTANHRRPSRTRTTSSPSVAGARTTRTRRTGSTRCLAARAATTSTTTATRTSTRSWRGLTRAPTSIRASASTTRPRRS